MKLSGYDIIYATVCCINKSSTKKVKHKKIFDETWKLLLETTENGENIFTIEFNEDAATAIPNRSKLVAYP